MSTTTLMRHIFAVTALASSLTACMVGRPYSIAMVKPGSSQLLFDISGPSPDAEGGATDTSAAATLASLAPASQINNQKTANTASVFASAAQVTPRVGVAVGSSSPPVALTASAFVNPAALSVTAGMRSGTTLSTVVKGGVSATAAVTATPKLTTAVVAAPHLATAAVSTTLPQSLLSPVTTVAMPTPKPAQTLTATVSALGGGLTAQAALSPGTSAVTLAAPALGGALGGLLAAPKPPAKKGR